MDEQASDPDRWGCFRCATASRFSFLNSPGQVTSEQHFNYLLDSPQRTMKLVTTLALLVITLQCSISTAQIDFVRSSDDRPVDFSTLTDPTPPPAGAEDAVPARRTSRPVGRFPIRRLRDGSDADVVVVGRNRGGFPPLRGEEPATD
jgi:hypothetical protein